MPNLILLVGIPGSGKSSLARSLFDLKYQIISTDVIRRKLYGSLKKAHVGQTPEAGSPNNAKVFATFHREIEDALNHGVDVIADATFLTAESREEVLEIAQRVRGTVRVHVVLFRNVSQAYQRNAARGPDAIVPPDVMAKMMTKYAATLDEIYDEPYDSLVTIGSYT